MSKKVSKSYLERAALHYLGRFNSTEANLKAVLARKVQRRNEENAPATDEQLGWINDVAASCVRIGYVNDTNYAVQRLKSLQRKGKPLRTIRMDLRYKGVPDDIIQKTLNDLDVDEGENPDLLAAAAYARRRRFGPFRRDAEVGEERLGKEKSAMMRAGFSYGLIQQVLMESSEEDLREILS